MLIECRNYVGFNLPEGHVDRPWLAQSPKKDKLPPLQKLQEDLANLKEITSRVVDLLCQDRSSEECVKKAIEHCVEQEAKTYANSLSERDLEESFLLDIVMLRRTYLRQLHRKEEPQVDISLEEKTEGELCSEYMQRLDAVSRTGLYEETKRKLRAAHITKLTAEMPALFVLDKSKFLKEYVTEMLWYQFYQISKRVGMPLAQDLTGNPILEHSVGWLYKIARDPTKQLVLLRIKELVTAKRAVPTTEKGFLKEISNIRNSVRSIAQSELYPNSPSAFASIGVYSGLKAHRFILGYRDIEAFLWLYGVQMPHAPGAVLVAVDAVVTLPTVACFIAYKAIMAPILLSVSFACNAALELDNSTYSDVKFGLGVCANAAPILLERSDMLTQPYDAAASFATHTILALLPKSHSHHPDVSLTLGALAACSTLVSVFVLSAISSKVSYLKVVSLPTLGEAIPGFVVGAIGVASASVVALTSIAAGVATASRVGLLTHRISEDILSWVEGDKALEKVPVGLSPPTNPEL